jgi:hypothetical protein
LASPAVPGLVAKVGLVSAPAPMAHPISSRVLAEDCNAKEGNTSEAVAAVELPVAAAVAPTPPTPEKLTA